MDLSSALTALYLIILVALAVYGFHRSSLVFLYYRHRDKHPVARGKFAELPAVTVQLPLFNEMYVVERLLDAVAAIRYPRDRFQIQVLDDSTDETCDICRHKIEQLIVRYPDLDIEYVHRTDRTGFKAGALENGLRTAKGELVLIFDADFVPNPDILERTVHHFLDPEVAVVQCRWEHINRDFSALTEAQALMLNGHFIMEHAGRNRSGRFFNFNGTAGLWRRAAIVDAGGWQHDTLTEDMDLSYRAQLRGWRFVYLPEIAAPAELPVEMSAFKAQQFRWAKGSIQVARKLLPRILGSKATFAQKSEAFFHLTNNFAYPLLLLLSLLLLPNLILRTTHGVREVLMIDLPLFFGTTLSIASFYIASEREVARLIGALAASGYLLIGRGLRSNLSFLTYVWLTYSFAAVALILAALVSGEAIRNASPTAWLLIAALAFGPQLLGHTAFNWALRRLSATFVAVSILGEPIGSALLAWWLLDEGFVAMQLAGFVALLCGILVAATAERRRPGNGAPRSAD